MNTPGATTRLLQAAQAGDAAARAAIDTEVYATLKRMARGRLGGSGPATLNPTALVHEAVARMLDSSVDAQSREHFFALAALWMRAVLVDHARRRQADNRGGGGLQVTLDSTLADADTVDSDAFLDLHEALEVLAREDARCASALELTYFGGLSASQLGRLLQVSVATVERDLQFGRAWLRRRLSR